MSEALFTTDCPSCGAPVRSHSATSVTLVCGYCRSLLVRRDDSLTDSGRDSALLEDFSPLQIGTTGIFATRSFRIAGRLQVRYDAGMWNEWYLLFDDGGSGWLSESGDLYSLTRPADDAAALPAFDDIRAGFSLLDYGGRRFTAAEITRDDVPYSVLQHFANQFTGAAPLFQRLMQEMAASINRDIWFTDNAEVFKAALANEEAATWLAGQPDILNKCLQNRLALGYIAQSTITATAILTREEALALWKNAPALWDIWPQHAAGMQVLAKSGELIDYLFSIPAAVTAVQKQPIAIRALASHAKGVRHMTTITFMKTIVAEEEARKGFIANNDIFQSVREDLYKAVSGSPVRANLR